MLMGSFSLWPFGSSSSLCCRSRHDTVSPSRFVNLENETKSNRSGAYEYAAQSRIAWAEIVIYGAADYSRSRDVVNASVFTIVIEHEAEA